MLGDIGGVYQVFLSVFGVLFYKTSRLSFTLKLIRSLFFVKGSTHNMFVNLDHEKREAHKHGMEKYLHHGITDKIEDQDYV